MPFEAWWTLAFSIPVAVPLLMPTRRGFAMAAIIFACAIVAAWLGHGRSVRAPTHIESLGDPLIALLIITSAVGLAIGVSVRLIVIAFRRTKYASRR
jgi:hypothetical protein